MACFGTGCGSPSMTGGFAPLVFSMYSANSSAACRVYGGASWKTTIGAPG